jgi:hypothetical protein
MLLLYIITTISPEYNRKMERWRDCGEMER